MSISTLSIGYTHSELMIGYAVTD